MNARVGLSIYNQDRLNDDEFIENFVARNELFGILSRKLEKISDTGTNQHLVLIGSRGMGKTSLLRRLAIEISTKEKLNQAFLPLRFREEQHNILTLANFWFNCTDSLANWCEENGHDEIADQLDAFLLSDQIHDCDKAYRAFETALVEIGKRPVLLIDNLNTILDTLNDQENWSLRKSLQSATGPLLVGASTEPLRQTTDKDAPFFEFFFPHFLEPLKEKEIIECMYALANKRGETGLNVKKILDNEPKRVRILHRLTGGNPRILVLLYRLLESSDTQSVFEDLEGLLEDVTPYYKARVEEYTSNLQRAIIDGIALNWDPITSKSLSDVTGIAASTLPAQLKRLKNDGLIKPVETSGSSQGYEIVERFFNIWYLMRHGTRRTKHRVKWLVAFFNTFYQFDELVAFANTRKSELMEVAGYGYYDRAISLAIESHSEREQSLEKLATGSFEFTAGENSDDVLEGQVNPHTFDWKEDPRLDDPATALTFIQDLLEERLENPENENKMQLMELFFRKAVILFGFDRLEDAITTFDDFIAYFGARKEMEVQQQVATALYIKGTTLVHLKRSEEAIEVYTELTRCFGDREETALQEPVAKALYNKGSALAQLKRSEEAIEVYAELIRCFGDKEETALQEQVAKALFNKGCGYSFLKRLEEAIEVYDDLISRFNDREETPLQEQVAKALYNKGSALHRLTRLDEVVEVFDELISRFGDREEMELQELVAKALYNKGSALNRLTRLEEAIEIFDDLIRRFGDSKGMELQEQVAKALLAKEMTLNQLKRSEEAIEVCDELIRRIGDRKEMELQVLVAKALFDKGISLSQLTLSEEAIEVFGDLIRRFGDSEGMEIQEQVEGGLLNKGILLSQLTRSEEAVAVFDDLIRRFGDSEETGLKERVARALFNKGFALEALEKWPKALAVYDDAVSRYGAVQEKAIVEMVINSFDRIGSRLLYRGDHLDKAETYYQTALSLSDNSKVTAMGNLSWLYILRGKIDKAKTMRNSMEYMPAVGQQLMDAGITLSEDNFGAATDFLSKALDADMKVSNISFVEDLNRFLYLAAQLNYGEKLLEWFEKTGHDKKQAPIYAGYLAYIRGEKYLLDFNKEVRDVAQTTFDWLNDCQMPYGK